MQIRWPSKKEDYWDLAEALIELTAGRRDVVARYHDFTVPDPSDPNKQLRRKGWGPWKGRRVAKDYQPAEGETVSLFKDYKNGGQEYRSLKPFSVANLTEHLRGKDRLGVYVLDQDFNVKFLAADFDDHDGKLDPAAVWEEVKRFTDTCETHDWKYHVERSKSGTGYHVWLFFDAPVSAAKVRAIGRWLFEESQTLREGDDFSTFDRFFPAQSSLPPNKKGFGNLIGLPLHGLPEYQEGKCAWLDNDGLIIPDPLEYTLDIVKEGRNSVAYVDEFMQEWELKEDAPETYDYEARDPDQALGNESQFKEVCRRCKFIQWFENQNNWDQVTEPLWFSWISNLARFTPGEDYIHKTSQGHPHYDPYSTELKIDHARTSAGPHKCKTIQENGFKGCPAAGCKLPSGKPTKSPAGLAAWGQSSRSSTNRTVNIEAHNEIEGEPWKDPELPLPIYEETGLPWPAVNGWEISTDGVKDHNEQTICLRPIWVDALTRNNLGLWGVSLHFFDLDWKFKSYAIPRERLHEQGGVLGRELAAQGLPVVPGKEKWVSRFVVVCEGRTNKRIRAAGRLGWFDAPESPPIFVLPGQVLGKAPEEIVYQPDVAMHTADTLHGRGKLREWQEHIATPCKGNPILMFSLMLGLAGPLLKYCQEQSGGFHLYGVTTGGKTTAVQVAASIWGCGADPQEGPEVTSIRKWYTTGNALESIAEVHNDTLLTLDEIGEVDPHELGRIIYQLAGGLSKSRANAGGGLRAMRTWRMLFFSTGEKSVRQMLAQVGQDQKGGQRVRLPDIPADDNQTGDRAIVTDAHGQDAKEFVQDLKLSAARYYGTAGPVFTSYLIAEAETKGVATLSGELREELHTLEDIMLKDYETEKPIELPPEGKRVLRRFALVALAGARAARAGVIDWDYLDIIKAIIHVRDRWLSEQGQERSEMDRALSHLRDQLIKNAGRFQYHDKAATPGQRDLLGFRVDDYYLLTNEGLRELCGEHDARMMLSELKKRGQLWHEEGRLTRKSPRLEGYGNRRMNLYWISLEFLGENVSDDLESDVAAGVAAQTGLALDAPTPQLDEDGNIPL